MEERVDGRVSMIPYFQLTTLNLGPIAIQVWGLMVALGIFAAILAATKLARERGQNHKIFWDLVVWVIAGAFLGARLFHILYEPSMYFNDPLELLKIWHGGFSVMGGFLGALLIGVWYLKRRKVNVSEHVDTGLFALPLGLFIGRIGCFLIHDHPGLLSDFLTAVDYPGGARHDHGLYLSLNGLILFLLFLWMRKKQVGYGAYTIVFLLWYGVVRFLLDFLRATNGGVVDTRYFGLTPAQYLALVMVAAGLWILFKRKKLRLSKNS